MDPCPSTRTRIPFAASVRCSSDVSASRASALAGYVGGSVSTLAASAGESDARPSATAERSASVCPAFGRSHRDVRPRMDAARKSPAASAASATTPPPTARGSSATWKKRASSDTGASPLATSIPARRNVSMARCIASSPTATIISRSARFPATSSGWSTRCMTSILTSSSALANATRDSGGSSVKSRRTRAARGASPRLARFAAREPTSSSSESESEPSSSESESESRTRFARGTSSSSSDSDSERASRPKGTRSAESLSESYAPRDRRPLYAGGCALSISRTVSLSSASTDSHQTPSASHRFADSPAFAASSSPVSARTFPRTPRSANRATVSSMRPARAPVLTCFWKRTLHRCASAGSFTPRDASPAKRVFSGPRVMSERTTAKTSSASDLGLQKNRVGVGRFSFPREGAGSETNANAPGEGANPEVEGAPATDGPTLSSRPGRETIRFRFLRSSSARRRSDFSLRRVSLSSSAASTSSRDTVPSETRYSCTRR